MYHIRTCATINYATEGNTSATSAVGRALWPVMAGMSLVPHKTYISKPRLAPQREGWSDLYNWLTRRAGSASGTLHITARYTVT